MLLSTAWIFFAFELALSVAAGIFFWRFWSQVTIRESVRARAILVYALGCLACLALTLSLPL